MADSTPPTRIRSLLSWLTAGGARFPGADAQVVPGMGVGLVAAEALQEEDPVLFVPRDLWFTRKTVHTGYGPILAHAQDRGVYSHSMSRLALLLALEHRTPTSFFRMYLDALGDPTVPYQLTPTERRAIQGLPLEGWIDDQRVQGEDECRALRAALPQTAPALDLAQWQWSYGHVMQRTFSVDVEDEEVWVLVPGMDLCNHADEPNARFFAEDDGWHLETSRPIRAGEQITIRYGRAKTSSDLLLYYGFVTPDNPNDRLHLSLGLSEDDPNHAEKRAAIEVLGLSTDALIGADGAIPSAFLHAAILWGLDSATFRTSQPDIADPAHARRALERIEASLLRALQAFPTSIEQDEGTQPGDTGAGWLTALTCYRLNVKRLHRAAAQGIRRRIDDIAAHGWSPRDVVEDDPDGRYGLATVRVTY